MWKKAMKRLAWVQSLREVEDIETLKEKSGLIAPPSGVIHHPGCLRAELSRMKAFYV